MKSIDRVISNNRRSIDRLAMQLANEAGRWGVVRDDEEKRLDCERRMLFLQQELQAAEALLSCLLAVRHRPEVQDVVMPSLFRKAQAKATLRTERRRLAG